MADEQNISKDNLSEVLQVRHDKLTALCESGNNPFLKTKYDIDTTSTEIKSHYEDFENKTVSLAGRIMSRRIMGKASFAGIRDGEGDIQLYVSRDDAGEEDYAAFKRWDIGDIIGISDDIHIRHIRRDIGKHRIDHIHLLREGKL